MSDLTWGQAASRVAGIITGSSLPDSLMAAKDAIEETLQDWDTRRDWRYTQVVAPDIALSASAGTFDLPTAFKKPYVAYLSGSLRALWYIEYANWHRVYPGQTTTSLSNYYTLFNEASTGKGIILPATQGADTLVVLYYRSITYRDADNALVDIPKRWTGYILAGARALLSQSKSSGKKGDDFQVRYERGIQKAKEDDLRIPDQFVSFQSPDALTQSPWLNPNSTWQATMGAD